MVDTQEAEEPGWGLKEPQDGLAAYGRARLIIFDLVSSWAKLQRSVLSKDGTSWMRKS